MHDYETVMETRDLGPGQRAASRARHTDLALVNVGQTYFAVDARCPNDGVHLGEEGRLDGYRLTCPGDGWSFDVRTGERVAPEGPGASLRRYDLRVEENRIQVGPPLETTGAPADG